MTRRIGRMLSGLTVLCLLLSLAAGCAKEETVTYTVTFDSRGGTAVAEQTVKEGDSAKQPADPEKTGFTFDGWQRDGAAYDFALPVTGDLMLVAVYTVSEGTQTVTVTFDADNGDEVSPVLIAKGESVTEPPAPEKPGYTFDGWFQGDVRFDFTQKIEADVRLTVHWKADPNVTIATATSSVKTSGRQTSKETTAVTGSASVSRGSTSGTQSTWVTDPAKPTSPSAATAGEKPYETLLRELNGYYWYLDGGRYAYLHPTVEPWAGHTILKWESQNLQVYQNTLINYENYDSAAYRKIDATAKRNTHNTLLANPAESAGSLITEYGMRVSGDKLSMTVGGKTYTFTRAKEKKEVRVSLTPGAKSLTKKKGEAFDIEVTVTPFWQATTVTAVSSNPKAVTVISGGVNAVDGCAKLSFRAVGLGTATLTLKGSKNDTATVTVTVAPSRATGIALDKKEMICLRGNTAQLKATVSPSGATDKTVIWKSSDERVASVSAGGWVTAKQVGTAVITATTRDGGYTAACTVTVKQKPLSVTASISLKASEKAGMGIFAEVQPTGGSDRYVAYRITLFRDGKRIGTVEEKSMLVTPALSGTYRAEVWVKDSEGTEAENKNITVKITVPGA